MYQYQLQKYGGVQSRYRCPACNHRNKTFKLYISTQTGQSLASHVGKCDREDKCGYHYTPRMWFEGNKSIVDRPWPMVKKHRVNEYGLSTMDHGLFNSSLKYYDKNNLVTYLTHALGADVTQKLIDKYHIGTAKHWPGATVFWQIDIEGKVRAGKIMLYNPISGKRIKQPYNHIAWAHSILKMKDFNLQQCFFGEHLLADNNLPVAIVESEKTALIASALLPGCVWLASGGISNLNGEHCEVLKGRVVTLYPDVNAYNAWQASAEKLMHMITLNVSDVLEQYASDEMRSQGLDLADCLLGSINRCA